MNRRTLVRVTIALAIGALITIPSAVALAGPGTFDVRAFGATGNGSTLDDDAIDAAINVAAADGGGGTVVFPAGTYLSRTIHLKSNITLQLDSGSTILAASSGMDAAEPNSFDQFQDYGHSHFHNALMWGDGIANLTITGSGTIDGNGLTTSNSVPAGVGDKILSLTRCSNLSLTGVTFRRGGHFAILMNGCHDVTIDNLKVLTSTDRDAINIINTSNVDLNNSRVEGRDDPVHPEQRDPVRFGDLRGLPRRPLGPPDPPRRRQGRHRHGVDGRRHDRERHLHRHHHDPCRRPDLHQDR